MTGRRDPNAVGGKRAVLEAIRAGLARHVLVAAGSSSTQALRDVLEAAAADGVGVRRVDRRTIDDLGVPDHRGVAAILRVPTELDERGLAGSDFPPDGLVVVLDGITDPQNLGACARSAEAAGAVMLVTRRRRAAPLSPAAIRASAGSLLHLPVAHVANITRAIERLKDRGFFVVGLDHRAEVSLREAERPPGLLALVVGAEDEGISRLVRETCDLLVAIPIVGRTASLNASAALAVGLFGYAVIPS